MIATVLLCLISTSVFCLGARGLIALSANRNGSAGVFGWGLSSTARRLVRGYLIFALFVLTAMAFAGAAVSYVELFTTL
jgi:hypothetical protein